MSLQQNGIQNHLPAFPANDSSEFPDVSVPLSEAFKKAAKYTQNYTSNHSFALENVRINHGYVFAADGAKLIVRSIRGDVNGFIKDKGVHLSDNVQYCNGKILVECDHGNNSDEWLSEVKESPDGDYPSLSKLAQSWPETDETISTDIDIDRLIDTLKAIRPTDGGCRLNIQMEKADLDDMHICDDHAASQEAFDLAVDHDVPIDLLEGSGEGGRVTVGDVENAIDRGVCAGNEKEAALKLRTEEGTAIIMPLRYKGDF